MKHYINKCIGIMYSNKDRVNYTIPFLSKDIYNTDIENDITEITLSMYKNKL